MVVHSAAAHTSLLGDLTDVAVKAVAQDDSKAFTFRWCPRSSVSAVCSANDSPPDCTSGVVATSVNIEDVQYIAQLRE